MSLNHHQRDATRAELAANLQLANTTVDKVADYLGVSHSAVHEAVTLTDDAEPVLVWRIRDYLDQLIHSHGHEPRPYTHLSENMRASAQMWFGIDD